MILLLDTNVASYIFKGDSRAADYAPILQGHRRALSIVTIAELFEWAAIREWGPKRIAQLDQTLTTFLPIPTDLEPCRH